MSKPTQCRKCGGEMKPGKALGQTYVGGMPDFESDKHSSTFSAGGSGKLIDCMKCCECGRSVTPAQEREATLQELADLGQAWDKGSQEQPDGFDEVMQTLKGWFSTRDHLDAEALHKLYTAGQAVRVKPLVWEGHGDAYWLAKPASGEYYIGKKTITELATGNFIRYEFHLSFDACDGHVEVGIYPTIEAAKAAGEAHHEAAIKSELVNP